MSKETYYMCKPQCCAHTHTHTYTYTHTDTDKHTDKHTHTRYSLPRLHAHFVRFSLVEFSRVYWV